MVAHSKLENEMFIGEKVGEGLDKNMREAFNRGQVGKSGEMRRFVP
ncbi:MAG: hypothetical protein ACOC6A_05445 [Chloroflexota bacterium]